MARKTIFAEEIYTLWPAMQLLENKRD
jgi:hypothetical protein